MRQSAALALFAGTKQHGTHRGSHTRAYGGHIRLHQLHGVVDGQTRMHLPTGSVQIHGDVHARVFSRQEQQLGLDDVGHVVVDGDAQEDDVIHHQTAEHIHLGHVQAAFFRNGGIDVAIIDGSITREGHRTDAPPLHCKFLEIGHYFNSLNLSWEIFLVWRVTSSRTLAMVRLSSHCSSRRRYWFWSWSIFSAEDLMRLSGTPAIPYIAY